MIEVREFVAFKYSEPEWDQIEDAVRDARLDVDQATRRDMEVMAAMYLRGSATDRQKLSRDKLETLRGDAENLRARIAGALAVHLHVKDVGPRTIQHYGVDSDMLDTTSDYFTKLTLNLDRQIKNAGTRTRRDNARKHERFLFWGDLLVIWFELGGNPRRRTAAAKFLIAASKPVAASKQVDAHESVETVSKWLYREKFMFIDILRDVKGRRVIKQPITDKLAKS